MDTRTTCGPLFAKVWECVPEDATREEIFSWGHLVGQAEKIWLGACYASMFRPNRDIHPNFKERLLIVARVYQLNYTFIEREGEYWLHSGDVKELVQSMESMSVDSAIYHTARGFLCGVPVGQIDIKFHERYAPGHRAAGAGIPGF